MRKVSTVNSNIRHFGVAAVLTVALGLSACGGVRDRGDVTSSTDISQGVSKDSIVLGTTLPLTGAAAAQGANIKAGIEAAVGAVNAEGGINGREVKLTVLDDAYVAAQQSANLRRLVESDKVFGLTAVSGSAILGASWPFLEKSGIPMMGALRPPDPKLKSVFMLGPDIEDQAAASVTALIEAGAKSVGAVYLKGDAGDAARAGVARAIKDHPGIKVSIEQDVALDEVDLSGYVSAAKYANPDAMFFANGTLYQYLKQMNDVGFKPKYAGTVSNVVTPEVSSYSPAEGLLSTQAVRSAEDLPTYRGDLKKYTSKEPTVLSVWSYSNTQVMLEVIKRMGDDLTWGNFNKTAEGMKDYAGAEGLPPVTFGPLPDGHSGTSDVLITKLEGGVFKPASQDFVEVKK